jgi:hypothetical protein
MILAPPPVLSPSPPSPGEGPVFDLDSFASDVYTPFLTAPDPSFKVISCIDLSMAGVAGESYPGVAPPCGVGGWVAKPSESVETYDSDEGNGPRSGAAGKAPLVLDRAWDMCEGT